MKKIIYVIVMAILIVIGELYSCRYGNGFYIKNKDLMYTTSITKINSPLILYDDGLFYISQNQTYVTKDSVIINIRDFIGYEMNDTIIDFVVKSDNFITLSFDSKTKVLERDPKIVYQRKDVKYDLSNVPTIVYYWRLIAFIFSMTIIILCLCLFYTFFKRLLVTIVRIVSN